MFKRARHLPLSWNR